MSTPRKQGTTTAGGEDAQLMSSFSAMKLHKPSSKRFFDRSTVEGSPVNTKKQDLQKTPFFVKGVTRSYDMGNSANDDGHMDDDGSRNLYDPADTTPTKGPVAAPTMTANNCGQNRNINVKHEIFSSGDKSSQYRSEKLLVITAASDGHDTGEHQENSLRTALLCGDHKGCLHRHELVDHLQWINTDNIPAACISDLLRVHDYAYLSHLEAKSNVHFNETPIPAGPNSAAPPGAPVGYLDNDTPLLLQSLDAAKRFCSAAMLAVDHVFADRGVEKDDTDHRQGRDCRPSRKAFVIGRPPGHHAGPSGCVPSEHYWEYPQMTSSGFCLLNTVGVAAAYARQHYGRTALYRSPGTLGSKRPPRIAIVDIDIHHGNGTEAIVRNLLPHQQFMPLPASWAPVSTLSYKPWLNEQDPEDVLFSSIHLYGGSRFYPCSGREIDNTLRDSVQPTSTTTSSCGDTSDFGAEGDGLFRLARRTYVNEREKDKAGDNASKDRDRALTVQQSNKSCNIINIELTPIGPGPWDREARAKLKATQREQLCKQAGEEFREKVTRLLLPPLQQLCPDLLFISAGFDAHQDDLYHFLTENDIHWVTRQLCDVVEDGGGGVISVLEGGYSLSSPVPPVARQAPPVVKKAPLPRRKGTAAASAATIATAGSTEGMGDSNTSSLPLPPPVPSSQHTDTNLAALVQPTASVSAAPSSSGVGASYASICRTQASAANTSLSSNEIADNRSNSRSGSGNNAASRPIRSKAKRSYKGLHSGVETAMPSKAINDSDGVAAAAAVSFADSSSHSISLTAPAAPAPVAGIPTIASASSAIPASLKFAQRPGDGGLVKGVLAHTAALIGRDAWAGRGPQ